MWLVSEASSSLGVDIKSNKKRDWNGFEAIIIVKQLLEP